MSSFSEKIQKRLAALAEDFVDQLPERLSIIKTLLDEVAEAPRDSQPAMTTLEELHRNVHKLSGSGATFGFTILSGRSKEMELALSTLIENDGEITEEEKASLQDLFQKIVESTNTEEAEADLVELSDKAEHASQPQQTGKSKTIYYFVESGRGLNEEDTVQLSFFGFTLVPIHTIEELAARIDKGEGSLILINTSILLNNKTCIKELSALKQRYDNAVNIIVASENDDFATRLMAVRAGSEAFFQFPLDIGRLTERIEHLTARKEEDPYHILIVDDDPEQVSFHALLLQQAGMITSVARDPKQVVKLLVEAKPELILMDMYMPGCSGMELAAIIRQQEAFVSIPIVFLSVETDMDKQLAAIRRGGDDFLTKPIRPEHLITSITNRAERTRSMRYLMERDSLTGLLNHTNLKEQLNREVMRANRTGSEMCFAMIDVDHFKKVNDHYGHLTGDRVLKGLARLLQERLRATDIIGRYGGEEYAVILLNTSLENAQHIMNEMRDKFSKLTQRAEGKEFNVTFSCGIAGYPDYETAGELNEAADKALYEAKETGRNRVVIARKSG